MSQNETEDMINQLAKLAMEAEFSQPIDWTELNIKPIDAFTVMASNVIAQMESVPDENRAVVAMATMTKLLVENFALNSKLGRLENNDATN